MVGKDSESHHRDLFETIEAGNFPRWTLFIQVMTDAQAKAFAFNLRPDEGQGSDGLTANLIEMLGVTEGLVGEVMSRQS